MAAEEDPYVAKPLRAAATFRVRWSGKVYGGLGAAALLGIVQTGIMWFIPRRRSRRPAYSYLAVTGGDLHILELAYGSSTTVKRSISGDVYPGRIRGGAIACYGRLSRAASVAVYTQDFCSARRATRRGREKTIFSSFDFRTSSPVSPPRPAGRTWLWSTGSDRYRRKEVAVPASGENIGAVGSFEERTGLWQRKAQGNTPSTALSTAASEGPRYVSALRKSSLEVP